MFDRQSFHRLVLLEYESCFETSWVLTIMENTDKIVEKYFWKNALKTEMSVLLSADTISATSSVRHNF